MSDKAARPRVSTKAARASIDLSKRDLTLDLARVVCVLLVVAVHLLEVGVGTKANGELVVSRPLEHYPWFAAATWVGQIMPLFFVVGGFASLTAWRSLQRRGGTAADYVRNRVLRLAQPALPLFIFYSVVIGAALYIVKIDPVFLDTVVSGTGVALWFLAAYTICQSLVPLMAKLHAAAPKRTVVVLLVLVIIVDIVRYSVGIPELGLPNLAFVWLLAQQFGFWYADGWFAARNGWQLFAIAAGAYVVLFFVVWFGPYSWDMLANLNPATLPLVILAVAQAAILRAARPVLAWIMTTHVAKAVVFLVGTRLMTIYLWHLPVIVALSGVALLIPGASPEPGTAAWWWTRPIVYAVVLLVIYGLSFLVGRYEAPRQLGPTPPTPVVALAAVLTFLPALFVLEFFLDFWLAVFGAISFGTAVLILGRWPAPKRAIVVQPATT